MDTDRLLRYEMALARIAVGGDLGLSAEGLAEIAEEALREHRG